MYILDLDLGARNGTFVRPAHPERRTFILSIKILKQPDRTEQINIPKTKIGPARTAMLS